jgi:hypothetical protein
MSTCISTCQRREGRIGRRVGGKRGLKLETESGPRLRHLAATFF